MFGVQSLSERMMRFGKGFVTRQKLFPNVGMLVVFNDIILVQELETGPGHSAVHFLCEKANWTTFSGSTWTVLSTNGFGTVWEI